jgi:glycosyltransferase involved in cell wall biosynthesis
VPGDALVSIVIPTYNYARFMKACLGSLRSQQYPELELVIVDDVSTDDSVEVARECLSDSSLSKVFKGRVRIEANEANRGAHETINKAIQLSRGKYIAILNADDEFGAGRVKTLVDKLVQSQSRIAFSHVDFIAEDGSALTGEQRLIQQLRMRQRAISRFPSVGFACLASNVAISTGNFVFERSLFNEIGPFADLRYCHDWDFLLRAIFVTEPLFVPDVSYRYRVHGSNTFRSLGGVAMTESATVYRAYFDRLLLGKPKNLLAPSPDNWPGVFQTIMSAYGLWQFWSGEHAA